MSKRLLEFTKQFIWRILYPFMETSPTEESRWNLYASQTNLHTHPSLVADYIVCILVHMALSWSHSQTLTPSEEDNIK